MRRIWVFVGVALLRAGIAWSAQNPALAPRCEDANAKQCVDSALQAMGGRARIEQLQNVRLQLIGHTMLTEQSYRQEPFLSSYERGQTTLDLAHQRARTEAKATWPESDPNQADTDFVRVATSDGCVQRMGGADTPCSLGDLDDIRQRLALGPERVLLAAGDAPDLRMETPERLRSTMHAVVAFTWHKVPVRIFLNQANHLPDAVETTQEFHDFWYFWGDVRQRIYFDNWQFLHGVVYPTNLIEERNGIVWRSTQALSVEFNAPADDGLFALDAKIAQKSAASLGWNRVFRADQQTTLAPGVDLFLGAWNSTIIRQSDGIVILEAPISGRYTEGVMGEARKRYTGTAIKAVLSTSDSWPHTGGVRAAVAEGLPVYILDLNQSLLDRMMRAPHTLAPDALENAKGAKQAHWKVVSGRETVGDGENRMELYPLRGASTERQYMVYFPALHLLYASDTLALNDDGTLYDPELMREVMEAVKREDLKVVTVFAMHQGPLPWDQVVALVAKAQK